METTQFIPEPLFVYDNASKTAKGYIGTFYIINRERPEEGYKWIGDVKTYGGTFPDYEEAKAYAKLFAASTDMLSAFKQIAIGPMGETKGDFIARIKVLAEEMIAKATT